MRFIRLALICGVFLAIAAAQMPTINQNGTVNGASYTTPNPPGSLVVAFGTNLTSKLLVASSTPLTMQMQSNSEDITVTIGGKLAPMFYVAQNQLSVQVPWETATSGTLPIVVTRNGIKSPAVQIPVGKFSPGIFTVSNNGQGMAWAINGVTGKVAQPAGSVPGVANTGPAAVGDHLFIYAVGLGPVSPAIADGAAPCPLSGCAAGAQQRITTTTPVVMIGGIQATVEFHGLAPQFPGVYQVNFKVPAGVPTGNSVSLQLQIGGISSNKTTLAIQ